MIESVTFMMGEFEATFPTDRQYAKNHMWAMADPSSKTITRFGFTSYAVRLLQDVYFLDWLLDAPAELTAGQEIGSIESKKAESALYAPSAGQLTQWNTRLMDDPSAINVDKYGSGWLFEMQVDDDKDRNFLSPDQYLGHLVEVWKITQRTIKGQLNE